jgi:hypothetical protein
MAPSTGTHLAQPPGQRVYNDQEDDCGDENMDVSPHIRTEHCHCLLQAFQRHRSLPQSSSASRSTAGASGFFIFSQSVGILSGLNEKELKNIL